MESSANYVGIDVSKKTFDVALPQEKGYKHKKFSNNQVGFKSLLEYLNDHSHCVMEASGPYYLRLATFLWENSIDVSVLNPLVIKRFSQMRLLRAKTDKADSVMIAEYGKTESPALWEPLPVHQLELKQMEALLEQYIKQRTGLFLQLEAFRESGIKSEIVLRSIAQSLEHIEEQIKAIEKEMNDMMHKHYDDLFKRLQSVPGIGPKAARMLIVMSGGFSRFSGSKELSSYVGLCPRIFESGTSVKGRAKICKMGMSKLRKVLYLCSWTAKRCNKACRELFDRLIEKGKSKKLALIAVANKLLKQTFAIATKNEFYTENYI